MSKALLCETQTGSEACETKALFSVELATFLALFHIVTYRREERIVGELGQITSVSRGLRRRLDGIFPLLD